MGLIKYKLGELIELLGNTNNDLQYGIEDVRGVNNLKKMMSTKADLNGRNLGKFQIVYPGEFFFNHRTSRNGSKFSITYNYESNPIICTEDYVVFRLKKICENILLKEWLYMYFNRSEFDRFVITNSWGSSTEFYNWSDVCDIELHLPPLAIQQKYVDVYNAMVANQKAYERGLDDLKLVCDAYIDKLKNKCDAVPIGNYITQTDQRNNENILYAFKGLSMENYFIDSVADSTGLNFSKYKIIAPGEYAAVLMKVGRDGRITIARNDSKENFLISPAYYSFKVDNINSNYFRANVNRLEFERRGWFACDTSTRSSLSWTEFLKLPIPKANNEEQEIISNLYETLKLRNFINEKLKAQIKAICPILIKGSIEEGRNTKEA